MMLEQVGSHYYSKRPVQSALTVSQPLIPSVKISWVSAFQAEPVHPANEAVVLRSVFNELFYSAT